ncbi:MAG: recombinase [bacterium]
MTDTYEQYEKECRRIRAENEKLLAAFADWLSAKGLAESTIRRHCENMDFYLNHFLLYEDAEEATSGVTKVDMFLGEWFIRKAMWANQAAIKSNAASLKKFYTFMVEKGKVEKEDLDELKQDIKAGMPEWLETMARYDDPEMDIEEVWGYNEWRL